METAYRNAWNAFVASIEAESPAGPTLAESSLSCRECLTVEFGGRVYEVESIQDAAAKWLEFVGDNDLGVSQVGNGLKVRDRKGRIVGRVSYNGRMWDADGNELPSLDSDEDEPTVEDRILSGETDRRVVADAIDGAHQGEFFRVMATAAGILADLVRREAVRLSPSDLSAIREAIRLDYASPI